ncbi:MAG: hypothetical protein V1909_03690 [Candidatus Micrarchaeota archaeon]
MYDNALLVDLPLFCQIITEKFKSAIKDYGYWILEEENKLLYAPERA